MIWQPPQPPEGIANPITRPGVRRRTDEPGDACPFLRSAPGFRTIPKQEWRGFIADGVNLSSQVRWEPYNQQQVGSCASESACQSLSVARQSMGLPVVRFNPYGIYGRVNGGSDSGSTLSANLAFIRDKGAFPESIWPRSRGWRTNPSSEAYEAAKNYRLDEFYEVSNWEEFGSALLQGWVVYWGYSGHAITGMELLNEEEFIYLNSWGTWGTGTKYSHYEHGFGKSRRSAVVWGYGVYAFRSAIIGANDLN